MSLLLFPGSLYFVSLTLGGGGGGIEVKFL